MYFYLNATIISLLVSGLACLIVGVITFINGYTKKSKTKIGRGWKLAILGTVIVSVFLPVLTKVLKEEVEGGDFLAPSFFFMFFFMPFVFGAVLVCIIFYIGIGTTSLKEGYTKNEEGKFNVESIVLGYIMLALGAVVVFSLIMLIGASLNVIGDSISNINKSEPVSSSDSSILLSVLFK